MIATRSPAFSTPRQRPRPGATRLLPGTCIYLQHRKRLELANQGGARARVQDVELLNLDQLGSSVDDLQLTFQCT